MNFKDLLLRAKSGDNEALTELLLMYRPLLLKESIVDGVFDEDLFQELCIVFLKCVRRFRVFNITFLHHVQVSPFFRVL